MIVLKIGFWLFVLGIFYTYIGYFLILKILARRRKYKLQSPEGFTTAASEIEDVDNLLGVAALPAISLIIPAFNEAAVIREKLENCLWLGYKKDKLEILVASDGSTDETNEIVREYEKEHSNIRLIDYPVRRGKISVLNDTIPAAAGEIIVLSDASSILSIDSLEMLARHFFNPKVGCVSGTYKLVDVSAGKNASAEGAYWKYETAIKLSQSKLYSILGAHGAIYAFLKKAFVPLPPDTINDDYIIPMRILEQGYKGVYETEAVGVEISSTDLKNDFKRRVRIMAGNFQQVVMLFNLLNPRQGKVAFHFFSHKVMRLVSPFLQLGCLVANIVLASGSWFFSIILAVQGLFYLMTFTGFMLERKNRRIRWFYIAYYFNLGNFSTFVGFYRFLSKKQSVKWERVEEKQLIGVHHEMVSVNS